MIQSAGRESLPVAVDIAEQSHDQLVPLVETTTFGSDGLQYRRLAVQSQLDRFCEPTFFHAIANGKLIGAYILDKRDLRIGGQHVKGYYRGVLAVDSQFQGRGVGQNLTRTAMAWMAEQAKVRPIVSYGCIDQSNQRSLNLLQSGGAAVGGSLSMYMMYRQWPALRCELNSLEDEHASAAHLLADELYADCQVRDVSASRLPGLVLQDDNGLAISARMSETSFRITRMGKMATWSTRFFVKPFAPARKRFDPNCFRYVLFSDVLIRPGCEKLWPRFVSTVLAQYQCHFGAVYVDPQSRLFGRLQKSQPLSKLLHSSAGSINVVWQSFNHAGNTFHSVVDNTGPVHVWPVDA